MADEEFDDLEEGSGVPDFLRDPAGIFRRRWLWMLVGLVLGLAGTVGAVLQSTPTYLARSSILVSTQQIPEEFVRTTVTEDPFSRLGAMVGTVLSRQKLISLIDEFGLYPEKRDVTTMDIVVEKMREAINVVPMASVGGSRSRRGDTARMFEVSYTSSDPEATAVVTNRLAALFVEGGLQSRMEHAIGISNFMREELEKTEKALRNVEREIAGFKEANRGALPDNLESNLRRLERLQEHRTSLARQIADAETSMAMLSSQPTPVVTPETEETPQARLTRLRKRYELELLVHTPEHPDAIALGRQVKELEAVVAALPSKVESGKVSQQDVMLDSARKRVAMLQAELRSTKQTILEIDDLVANTSKTREELTALTERATVLRAKYNEFLRKVSEAEMAQSLEAAQYGARVSIVDRATTPTRPENSRRRIAAMGVAGAIALALLIGLVLEFFDPVVVDQSQLESLTGLPVLGSAPNLS